MSLSVATKKPAAKKKPARAKPAKPKPASQKGLDFCAEPQEAEVIDFFTGETLPPLSVAFETLKLAMGRSTPRPLPMQEKLESHFDGSLVAFKAVWSAEIAGLLRALGAEAAVLGDKMALKSGDVSFETLRHETAHLLQVSKGFVSAPDAVEAEAEAQAPGAVEEGLSADTLAFRSHDLAVGEATEWEQKQEFRAEANAVATEEVAPEKAEAVPEGGSALAEAAPVVEVPEAAPPPSIESELPPLSEAAEAAKAGLEESQAALAAAITPEGYMAAFKAALPSVKARKIATLTEDMAALADGENKAHEATLPSFSATLVADESAVDEVPPVAPPSEVVALPEEDPLGPIPAPDIALTQQLAAYDAQQGVANWASAGETQADARQVAQAIGKVPTSDEEVETSAGPAPTMPLTGEADPKRAAAKQMAEANAAATVQRDIAQTAVIDGPGPEQVQLRAMDEPVPLNLPEKAPTLEATPELAGPEEFLSREFDSETTAIFDAHNASAMEESLSEAEAGMSEMVQSRDSQRSEATAAAEADMQAAEREANSEQASEVNAARQGIQLERQAALDSQTAEVGKLHADAAKENMKAQADIDARVEADEAEIARQYKAAETEANAEVTAGEAKAAKERAAAEKEAEDDGWFSSAVSWVGDQLKKLGDLIGDIFDAVRSAVGAILDAVKAVANTIIDAAARFVKGAIAAYGAVLKLAVTGLIGQFFPEVAKALNAKIDEGVAAAQNAVDVVAEGLKKGVAFIVDTYKAVINAILNFVEGALNTVLAVAYAALTGDWAEVARLVLEPILAALGINKDDFYAFVGNALDALLKIIDDPVAFLGHLMDTVIGGFKLFGQNFVDNLISGIIGWLTGAFAGTITLPKKFDLLGILDIARQILGLTLDMLRKIAVRVLGEAAVEKIEFFLGYAKELIVGGWGAFFEKIKDDLNGLVSMVMTGITTFLLEKVVKAGIIWLASLINPAGALVKLILMIWDAIMWLKDNLARFVAIIQTIVQGMVDIANGKTETASKAIEKVLVSLMGPAIDLIARLLGLGNVAAKVKEIIAGIHKRIEDAAVKLIKSVLAKFTGGKGGAKPDDKPKSTLKPVKFSGNGESHTLYAEKRGKDFVPMMRSTPTPVETWLKALKTQAGVKAQLVKKDKDVTDETVAAKLKEIKPFVATALKEEADLDKAGDKNSTTVQSEAKQTATALSKILEALGLADAYDFKKVFKDDLDKIQAPYQADIAGTVAGRINKDPRKAIQYGELNWAAAKTALMNDPTVMLGAWNKPFHAGGILRTSEAETEIIKMAKAYIEANQIEGVDTLKLGEDGPLKKSFFATHLLGQLKGNDAKERVLGRILSEKSADIGSLTDEIKAEIGEAAKALAGDMEKKKPDAAFKDKIKVAAFRKGGLFETDKFLSLSLPYSKEGTPQGTTVDGPESGDYPLNWFLNKVPEGSKAGSPFAQQNITYLANVIRAADRGKHEWILASQANEAIAASIRQLKSEGGTKSASGVANFVRFLNHVRTDTSDLIFEPEYANKTNEKRIKFFVSGHKKLLSKLGTPEYEADKKALYEGQPKYKTEMPALQAHTGGLYAKQLSEDGKGVTETPSSSASPKWHIELRKEMGSLLAQPLTENSMQLLGDAILRTLEKTTLSEASEADILRVGGIGFAEYRFGGSKDSFDKDNEDSSKKFDNLIAASIKKHQKAGEDLKKKIAEVINYSGAVPV